MKRVFGVRLLILLVIVVCMSAPSVHAALTTTGSLTPDGGVYQVGTSPDDRPYLPPANSFNDGNPTYYLITQTKYDAANPAPTTYTYQGVTYPLAGVVTLPAYDETAATGAPKNNSTLNHKNPGLGSPAVTAISKPNTTLFVDSGTYRDESGYYQFSQPNLSLVGVGATPPVFKRVSTIAATDSSNTVERRGFAQPNIYVDNVVFDGNGMNMYAKTGQGYYSVTVGTNANQIVMQNVTIQNVGATASFSNKNVGLNLLYPNDTNPTPVTQMNFVNMTFSNVKTGFGYGILSTNQANNAYFDGVQFTNSSKSAAANEVKIEHSGLNALADLTKNAAYFYGNMGLTEHIVYIQDDQYELDTLPESYRYVYYRIANGTTSNPGMLVSDLYVTQFPAAQQNALLLSYAIYDRQERCWVIDQNLIPIRDIAYQLNTLRIVDQLLESLPADQPPLIIKYVASGGTIAGFTLPDYGPEPVNVVGVDSEATPITSTALVKVAAGALFNLNANNNAGNAAQVSLRNFDFDALASYTLQEAVNGVAAQTNPDAYRNTDPYNGSYTQVGLNYAEYVPATAQAQKVANSTQASFENCAFTTLADDLLLNNASINTLQDIPLLAKIGEPVPLGVTATTKYTVNPALPAARVLDLNANNSDPNLYYVSSDPTVATVDAAGNVTMLQPGAAYIYVKAVDVKNQGEIEKPYARFVVVQIADVEVTKTWVGGPVEDHTAVELALYRKTTAMADPEKVTGDPVVTGTNPFTYVWKDLALADSNNLSYTFTVEEPGATAGKVIVNGHTYQVAIDGLQVTNTYAPPAPVQMQLSATKVLNGRTLQAGEFTFHLLGESGDTPLQTATNAANGAVTFEPLSFEGPGRFVFRVKEVTGTQTGITYDWAVYKLTIDVTLGEDNALTAQLTGLTKDGATLPVTDAVVFTNAFAAPTATPTTAPTARPTARPTNPPTPTYPVLRVPLMAKKTFLNGSLKAGEFTFELRDRQGRLLATVTNAADGSIVFPDRTFSKEVANFLYTIREVKGTERGVTYDTAVYTVKVTTKAVSGVLQATVEISKDGVPTAGGIHFTNKRDLPKTGDSALQTVIWLLSLSLITGAAALVLKKRSNRPS